MVCKKLESLPDEILLEIIEKYIDSVHLIVAFYRQLNQRFDRLISGSQRLSFDFRRCRKHDFHRCLDFFSSHAGRVNRLALSDGGTPGQLHLFLSHFPAFTPFCRLRSLSLFVHNEPIDQTDLTSLLSSMASTQLETLSIVFHRQGSPVDLEVIVSQALGIESLKRLHIDLDSHHNPPSFAQQHAGKLQSLTLSNVHTGFRSMENISRNLTHLTYLSANLSTHLATSSLTMIPMVHLHTLDLSLRFAGNVDFHTLRSLFQAMPILQHLTVELCPSVTNAFEWQELVQTSLPPALRLTLWFDYFRWFVFNYHELLASFQTSFWIQYETFRFLLVRCDPVDCKTAYGPGNWECMNRYTRPISSVLVAPKRLKQKPVRIIDKFGFIKLSTLENMDTPLHYLEDVDSLLVDSSIPANIEMLLALFDCSRVTWLTLTTANLKPADLNILLQKMNRIRTLRTHHDFIPLIQRSIPDLVELDLSLQTHGFDDAVRSRIGRLFPALEHLKLKTDELELIPTIHSALPRLRCLEFHNVADHEQSFSDDMLFRLLNQVPSNSTIRHVLAPNSIQIWIDEDILQDSFHSSHPCKKAPDQRSSRLKSMKSLVFSFLKRSN